MNVYHYPHEEGATLNRNDHNEMYSGISLNACVYMFNYSLDN